MHLNSKNMWFKFDHIRKTGREKSSPSSFPIVLDNNILSKHAQH